MSRMFKKSNHGHIDRLVSLKNSITLRLTSWSFIQNYDERQIQLIYPTNDKISYLI